MDLTTFRSTTKMLCMTLFVLLTDTVANCSLYPVQVTGRWLDAAGWEPGEAIQCGTKPQQLISIIATAALVIYGGDHHACQRNIVLHHADYDCGVFSGQVMYHSVVYTRKSSVIIIDQRFMLVALLLKIFMAVNMAAIG